MIITLDASLTPMDHSIVRLLLLAALLLVVLVTGPASALTWQIETVDSAGVVGRDTSLALNGTGIPHISYFEYNYDGPDLNLKYAWYDGSSWQNETVDSDGDVGSCSSLAIDAAGTPRISYQGQGVLMYAWRDGTGWHRETVDSSEGLGVNRGGDTSLALDAAGNPRIAYTNYGNPYQRLKYAWRDGAGWHAETVDPGYCGPEASLALDGAGNPCIAYREDPMNNQLKYAWRDGDGWHFEYPDPAGSREMEPSLALDSAGNPRIGYRGISEDDELKFAWRDGTGWHSETVDSNPVGQPSLVLEAAGSPRISYYNYTAPSDGDLKYAWRDGGGWHSETVDSEGDVGRYSSLALDGAGNPRISYNAYGIHDLKYASAGPPPPAAEFAANVTSGAAPLAVGFTDLSTGSPTGWTWEFGDGATADVRNPVHVYASPGTYTVNLTAVYGAETDTRTKPGFIKVVQPVPGAPAAPTDTDGDGLFDDVNGNDRADFADVVLYFNQMTWIDGNQPVSAFDYNANGRIDFADVVWLFNRL